VPNFIKLHLLPCKTHGGIIKFCQNCHVPVQEPLFQPYSLARITKPQNKQNPKSSLGYEKIIKQACRKLAKH
jgi:hypothetical protein